MRINNYNAYSTYANTIEQKNKAKEKTVVDDKNGTIDKLELSTITKSNDGLPKELIAKIKEFAKNDAKIGDYMTPKYHNFITSYMKSNISPNRAALMTSASWLIPKLPSPKNAIDSFLEFYGVKPRDKRDDDNKNDDIEYVPLFIGGESFSASRKMNYVSIKDEYGNEVLSWGVNSGWLSHSSHKEQVFHSRATNVYAMAYDKARDEMRANGKL